MTRKTGRSGVCNRFPSAGACSRVFESLRGGPEILLLHTHESHAGQRTGTARVFFQRFGREFPLL